MIYVIRQAGTPFYKIGFTDDNPERRAGELQLGSPRPLNPILFFEGGAEEEAALHEKLDEYRVQGEWFKLRSEDFFRIIVNDFFNQEKIELSQDVEKQRQHFLEFLDHFLKSDKQAKDIDKAMERNDFYTLYEYFCKMKTYLPLAKKYFEQYVDRFKIGKRKVRNGCTYYSVKVKDDSFLKGRL